MCLRRRGVGGKKRKVWVKHGILIMTTLQWHRCAPGRAWLPFHYLHLKKGEGFVEAAAACRLGKGDRNRARAAQRWREMHAVACKASHYNKIAENDLDLDRRVHSILIITPRL